MMGDPVAELPLPFPDGSSPNRSPPNRQAKTWDKARRLARIPPMLEARPRSSAELARELQVGIRSVQRDLEALREMGHPIETDRHGSHTLPRRGAAMRAPEALAAYAALRLAHHHAPGLNRHYRAALDHIARALPESVRQVLGRSLHDTGAGGPGERELELVSSAWLECRVLRFDYARPGGELERGNELCVYFIEISRTNLAPYVIGLERRRRGQVRTFKLSRMENLSVLNETYPPDPDFDPRAFLSDAWGVIGGGKPVTVTVRFAPEAAYRLREGGYPHMRLSEEAGGSVLAEFRAGTDRTGLPRELIPFLLGWGPRAEVLSPPSVREHWLEELREALRRYDRDS